ncbi:MAG: hypothetical protein DWQ04_24500 [Chloroflexi bacterium]|nr:MAG: hypothetical protein DWQ04_24500 [Chloroflexota bacterium]
MFEKVGSYRKQGVQRSVAPLATLFLAILHVISALMLENLDNAHKMRTNIISMRNQAVKS